MITREIQKTIEGAIDGAIAHVLDPMNDERYLQAIVICSSFEGRPLVKQHQMVMNPLKEAFAQSVHALGLKTFTPAKWDEFKGQYTL